MAASANSDGSAGANGRGSQRIVDEGALPADVAYAASPDSSCNSKLDDSAPSSGKDAANGSSSNGSSNGGSGSPTKQRRIRLAPPTVDGQGRTVRMIRGPRRLRAGTSAICARCAGRGRIQDDQVSRTLLLNGGVAWHVTEANRSLKTSDTGAKCVSDLAGKALHLATRCSTRRHSSSYGSIHGPSTPFPWITCSFPFVQ